MASIRETDTKWHIRFQKKGRKEAVYTFPKTLQKRTIERKKILLEEQVAMGKIDPWKESLDLSLETVIQRYIEVNSKSGNWSESTQNTNRSRLEKLSPFYDQSVQNLDKDSIEDRLHNLNVSEVTRKGHRSTWNAFFNWLAKNYETDKITVDIPIKDKIELRNTKSIKYLSFSEVERICKAIHFLHRQTNALYKYPEGKGPEFYCDMIWFAFYSLLRRSEITKLKKGDYKAGKLTVHGKGRRIDTITLPPPAKKILHKYKDNSPMLVSNMNRPEIHFKRAMKLALDKSKGRFHLLRHSGIVYYISEGIPVQFVSKLARHKSIQVTLDQYGDVIPDKMEEAFSGISH